MNNMAKPPTPNKDKDEGSGAFSQIEISPV
jgi:hypothetical protein